MATVVYPAVATGDRTAGYSATFPDLPNCTARGSDLADLLTQAREALRDHLTGLSNGGHDWPEPTPLEHVSAGQGTLLAVDITLEETPVRVNISIGERLLKRIDAAAEARGMTRSGFIASACRRALGEAGATWGSSAEWENAAKRMHDEFSDFGRRMNENLGPGSAFARNMSELDDKISDAIRRTADSVASALRRRQAERQDPEPPPEPPPPPNA
jgi:predicted RNase H-like HicB family nuclease